MDHETSSYLMHHGVKGMKWGVRKEKRNGLSKEDYKQRKKINKALKKDNKVYRTHDPRVKNRMKVTQAFSKELNSDKKAADAWAKAFTAYKQGDSVGYNKHLSVYNKRVSEIKKPYNKQYVDAFLKDKGITKVSDINYKYLNGVINEGKTPDYIKKKK